MRLVARLLSRFEDLAVTLCLAGMVLLPLAEIVARNYLGGGIRGSTTIVQHLTLWVGFLGSALAAREGNMLSFASREFLRGRWSMVADVFSSAVAAAVSGVLFHAGIELIRTERQWGSEVTSYLPTWVAELALPIAFGLIGVRLVRRTQGGWIGRGLVALGLVGGILLGRGYELLDGVSSVPGLVLLLAATLAGGPIFAALGGIAALLLMTNAGTPVTVLAEAYSLAVNPTLAALPIFTLVGYLLAEGNASRRLLRFFRAFVGWIPGGTALVCTLICVFFTIPTGGSGVTILALGGLLFQALRQDGYPERFSLGLLTGSGSLGLLFPFALPLILYGIVATIPIEDLFLGGIVPGVVLVCLVAAWGIRRGITSGVKTAPFDRREALAATWEAKWEILVPVFPVVSIFVLRTTIVEAAAVTALYTFLAQTLIHHDISFRRNLFSVFTRCIALIGGVILILGMAKAFSYYMVDAQVPANLLSWVRENIESKILFLLCLNLFLLVVGCLMDIFSATVVVVPLIAPLGEAFHIDPIHLGIIFVANLELGYLTPPVGLNLFFASYRFDRPLLSVYRAAVPMLLILGLGVLLITYIPALTTGLLALTGR